MEVYQSAKTSAEMEYALGAVPSIGENGNWFIGQQDTGIFAAGVNVTGAEPGQIVKITQVNEAGLPVAWEAADLPSGNEWRHIRTVTIPADITVDTSGVAFAAMTNGGVLFAFDRDKNGEPFELTDLFVVYNAGSANSATGVLCLRNSAVPGYSSEHGSQMMAVASKIHTTGQKLSGHALALNIAGRLVSYGGWNTGGAWSTPSTHRDAPSAGFLTNGKWTAIGVCLLGLNSYGFEEGSSFAIYGR